MKIKAFILQIILCISLNVASSQQLYTGVWRAGTEDYYLWSGVEWSNFNAKWAELVKQNLRLIDIEIYSYPACYPTVAGVKIATSCARYLLAWKTGNPTYGPQFSNSLE